MVFYTTSKTLNRPDFFIFVNDKIVSKRQRLVFLLLLTLMGCQSVSNELATTDAYTYVDSTQYFDDRTASVSMRAAFTNSSPSRMTRGYLFQFRSINKRPAFLNSISIIAGGKRLFLEQGQVVLPVQKGLTLQLSLEQSLEVAKYASSLLQFRHNNESYLFTIELHQLNAFSPQ